MKKEKIKVYLYTRVSTTMQIDGYSLDAQKTKMKAFCDYNEYEIAGEYEDAGKSGKSIEGRVSFNQMMEDIKSGKDGVSRQLYHNKETILSDIDSLDYEDKHYQRKTDLENHLYKTYDKIDELIKKDVGILRKYLLQ